MIYKPDKPFTPEVPFGQRVLLQEQRPTDEKYKLHTVEWTECWFEILIYYSVLMNISHDLFKILYYG